MPPNVYVDSRDGEILGRGLGKLTHFVASVRKSALLRFFLHRRFRLQETTNDMFLLGAMHLFRPSCILSLLLCDALCLSTNLHI